MFNMDVHTLEILNDLKKNVERDGRLTMENAGEAIEKFFADHGLHVWSIADVYEVAQREGYPMSDAQARKILKDCEDDVDSELGFTWMSLEYSISDSWWPKMSFNDLLDPLKGDEFRMAASEFTGRFVVSRIDCDGNIDEQVYVHCEEEKGEFSATLFEAITMAKTMFQESGDQVAVTSVQSSDCLETIEEAYEWGHEIMVFGVSDV